MKTCVGHRFIEVAALLSLTFGTCEILVPKAGAAAAAAAASASAGAGSSSVPVSAAVDTARGSASKGIEREITKGSAWWPAAPVSERRALELEKILVTGNSYVSDAMIAGTLRLSAGDTVNAAILEEARLRLLRGHHLLSDARFSTRPGSRRGLLILDVAVVERKPVSFETGFGYHDIYGWFLTLLGVRVDPGFTRGTELGLGLRLGFHIAGLDGGFERRGGPGSLGFGGNFHIYSQKHIFFTGDAGAAGDGIEGSGAGVPGIGAGGAGSGADDTGEYSRELRQQIDRSGAELYLLYEVRDRTRFSFGLRAESVRPDSSYVDSESGEEFRFIDFPASLQPEIKNTVITGLFIRAVRDTRDRLGYPRSGSFVLLQMQSNNTFLGGDEIFAKAELDFRKHIGLGNWRVLSSRLAAGITSTGAPYYERFFIGGMYSVRGFRELSLSPPSGNDGFVIASGELRFPLIASAANAPRLAGLVFVDGGLGWLRGTPLDSSDIEAAAGYGVRLRLPWIGTLGLDAGVPFTDGRTGNRFYVHGSLGFSF